MAEEYLPVFAEEIFIVNLYGTDEEIDEFNLLMQNPKIEKNLISMALLIEEIKRRSLLKMNWYCCWRCHYFPTCKINWYRGERNYQVRNCCTYCQNFWECHEQFAVQDGEPKEKPNKGEICGKAPKPDKHEANDHPGKFDPPEPPKGKPRDQK